MKKQFFVQWCLLLSISLCAVNTKAQSPSVLLSAHEFESKMQELNTSAVVDVRTPEEYTNGHIANAVNIDWLSAEFESKIASLDASAPVFIYCLGGGRSASAATRMRELGFKEIYELDGGILKWRAASLPEVIPAPILPGLSKSQFDDLIDSHKTVMIVFYGTWCGQCNKIKPGLKEIENELAEQIKVFWINVDDNRNLVRELGIGAIPVVQVYEDHALMWSHTGLVDKVEVLEHVQ